MNSNLNKINIFIERLRRAVSWNSLDLLNKLEDLLKYFLKMPLRPNHNSEFMFAFHIDLQQNLANIIGRRGALKRQEECILFITKGKYYQDVLLIKKIIENIKETLAKEGVEDFSHLLFVIDNNNNNNIQSILEDTFSKFFISDADAFKSMLLASDSLQHIIDRLKPCNYSKCLFHYLGPCNPKFFVGRDKYLEAILKNEASAYAIAGGRKIGKTSLLFKLMSESKLLTSTHDFYPIFIDCSNFTNFHTLINDIIFRRLRSNYSSTEFSTALKRGYKGRPLFLLLDEFDSLIEHSEKLKENTEDFGNSIRELVNRGRLKIVLCGFRKVFDIINNANHPFYNLFERIQLDVLSEKETRKLVTIPFLEMNILLESSKEIVDKIYDFTSGHPSVIQFICRRLYEVSDKKTIKINDLDKVLRDNELIYYIDDTFIMNTSPLERLISILTLQEESFDIDLILSKFEQENINIFDPIKVINRSLRNLMFNNILKMNNNKKYTFLYPLMKDIIKAYLASPLLIKTLKREVNDDSIS